MDGRISSCVCDENSGSQLGTYMQKYASHPDRAGYLFVVTDLETVHFEELSATSVPTRLGHIAALEGGTDDTAGMGMSAQQARTEEAMRSLASAFEHDWKGATIERDVDDYFVGISSSHIHKLTTGCRLHS